MECIKTPEICAIAAVAEKNRVVGKDNNMPWHIPADLIRFRKLTLNHPVIMGRRTFESLGKPLPRRTNVVISRQAFEGCIQAHSLPNAVFEAWKADLATDKLFIIGGAQVYEQAMATGMVNRLYLTLVKGDFEGDTYFPDYSDFRKIVFEEIGKSNGYEYKFVELEK